MSREFNADQKARERENAKVTIGETEYRPARRTTVVMKDIRKMMRADRLLADEERKLASEENRSDEQTARIAEIEDERERLVYEMCAGLLAPSNGNPISLDHIVEHLDIEDAGSLLDFLLPDDEQKPENPTSAQPTESTTT